MDLVLVCINRIIYTDGTPRYPLLDNEITEIKRQVVRNLVEGGPSIFTEVWILHQRHHRSRQGFSLSYTKSAPGSVLVVLQQKRV